MGAGGKERGMNMQGDKCDRVAKCVLYVKHLLHILPCGFKYVARCIQVCACVCVCACVIRGKGRYYHYVWVIDLHVL